MVRTVSGPAALFIAAMLLGACNTIEGAARDVQAAGGGISHAAREVNRNVFGDYGRDEVRAQAVSGDACDPYGTELVAGNLPPCNYVANPRPVTR